MGSLLGSMKIAAKNCEISLNEYLQNIGNNLKRCYKCKTWKPISEYGVDNTRGDKLTAACLKCRRVKDKRKRTNLAPSEKIRNNAADAVRFAIKRKEILPATEMKCFYCGENATEYHHYLGYDKINFLDIKAVCRKCHVNIHFNNIE